MEDDNCVIKDKRPSDQLIEKVPMTRNLLFLLRIVLDMKAKTNTVVSFKEKSKEIVEPLDKKENGSANLQVAFQTEVRDESWLWHFKFGHLNFGGLKLLHTKNMVKGLPLIDIPERVCEGCIFSKQHRETFPIGKSHRACTPLEIMHSDICGPMQTSSIGGCKYFLTFIDGYSRKTCVYFLKHKSDAFSYFQQFKALMEN